MQVLTASQICTICKFAGVIEMDTPSWQEDGSGCDAIFIKIDGVSGLKAFHDERVAKLSYHYSRIFSHFGYTPRAWGLSSVKVWGREFFYFFTETCEEYYEDGSYEYDEDEDEDYYEYPGLIHFEDRFRRITGFQNLDIHPGNYGYLNGELVCIDVGHIAYIGGDRRVSPKFD
jgi:hypothetical protein